MANFIDDYREYLVADASITDYFGERIFRQELPENLDRSKPWLRWHIEDVENTYYAGQAAPARSTYTVLLDVLLADPNEVPRVADWVSNRMIATQRSGNIRGNFLQGKPEFAKYEEKDLYVGIITLRVVYVNK